MLLRSVASAASYAQRQLPRVWIERMQLIRMGLQGTAGLAPSVAAWCIAAELHV